MDKVSLCKVGGLKKETRGSLERRWVISLHGILISTLGAGAVEPRVNILIAQRTMFARRTSRLDCYVPALFPKSTLPARLFSLTRSAQTLPPCRVADRTEGTGL